MATKLKNLKIKKVDFVDQGANPDAHIRMVKRKDGKEQSTGENSKKVTGFFRKMFSFIGKAAGMNQDEIDSAMDEIQKGDSVSFEEKFNEAKNRKIADEIWDICYALQSSLCSILNDEELDSTSAATAMKSSLDEFNAVMQESITEWSNGKAASIVMKTEEVSESDIEVMKAAVKRLNKTIEKATKIPDEDGPHNNQTQEGEKEEMEIDKSKMTPTERAFLEGIEKHYGVEDGDNQGEGNPTPAPAEPATETVVTKSAPQANIETVSEGPDDAQDSIYKGLHPAVVAELTELKKFKEEAEDRELAQVAKKYEIIGKKSEELVPMFKSLKAAGGTAYNDMIAVLDQTVETVEKSGAFSEIGKAGHSTGENSAEAKINTIAKGMMEKDATLSYSQALAKAWEDHPELMEEYDEQEGF